MGRQTAAGADSFAFDLAGNMTHATVGSVDEGVVYSGDNVRQSATLTVGGSPVVSFATDRQPALRVLAAEDDGSGGLIRSYLYGRDLLAVRTPTTGPVFLHHDGLGSVTDVTSATGTPLAWTEYQPFGAVRTAGAAAGAPSVPFAYAGQYRDPTGLYDMRAREYDPTTGRFLSVDPLPPGVGRPCISTYAYAGNDPVGRIDPSGMESQPASGGAGSSCPGGQLAGTFGIVAFALVDFGLGLTLFIAPEIHLTPPMQILDSAAIGGTIGSVAAVVYFASHPCP